jgi:hypothetical protein
MAKYLVLIYGDEQTWADASAEWQLENGERHRAFVAAAGDAVIGGHELEPSSMATSLRLSSAGRLTATDGPFVETKEGIGGYYLLEAPDLDEAIRLAGLVPEASATSSGVEIRPVHEAG